MNIVSLAQSTSLIKHELKSTQLTAAKILVHFPRRFTVLCTESSMTLSQTGGAMHFAEDEDEMQQGLYLAGTQQTPTGCSSLQAVSSALVQK